MQVTPRMFLIVLPMAFLAALVDAIAGGGGLISLPAYTLAGLDYDYASGTNKLAAATGTIVATIRYLRSGKVQLKPALWAMLPAVPGSWLGTRAAMALGTRFMTVFMVVAMPVVGVLVLLRKEGPEASRPLTRRQYPLCALIGLAIGFYDGFFGPGTGTLLIALFTMALGMDMVSAAATSKPVNLASNLTAAVTRLAAGNVLFALAIPAVFCAVAGGWAGSKLALVKGARLVRWVMLGVLGLLTVKLAVDLIAG